MKSLDQIELDYIKDIIEFFCREYTKMIKFDGSGYKQAELLSMISKQIDVRLVSTRLLYDYKVNINVYPKYEKRNAQIENVLEGKNIILEDNIHIFYEKSRGYIYEYMYKL